MKSAILLLALIAIVTFNVYSDNTLPPENEAKKDQDSVKKEVKKYNGIKINIYPDGSSYIKIGVLAQIWYAYDWNNPGSTASNGELAPTSQAFGLRRARMSLYANHQDKYHFYTQFGTNNVILTNGGANPPLMFFHDFWGAYTVKKNVLNIGAGLSAWNGISRLSNSSSVSKLLLDYQNFALPNILRTDQFGRQLGAFAFGNLSGISYRFAVTQPFIFDNTPAISTNPNSAFEIANDNLSLKGYAAYNFFDKETSMSSFYSMNYLGAKKILNVGAGFDIHPGSVAYYNESQELVKENRKHFGVDLYMELPQKNGSVVNIYSVGYSFDFGPNYLRSIGLMQPVMEISETELTTPQGAGVRQYFVGTGKVWYTNLGYLLPTRYLGENVNIQPFVAANYKDFEGLCQASWQYDAGINYFIDDHNFKISAQYSTRPVYHGTVGPDANTTLDKEKGMFIFQLQMSL